jgi:hypothetical protein
MGAQGGTTDITGFFRLGSFCHSAILPLPKTRQVVASKTNLENAVISGVVCVAARKGRLHARSRVPSSHQTASLKSLLLSQLGCSAKNDAADGGLSARAAAALHLLRFRRMALFCRFVVLPLPKHLESHREACLFAFSSRRGVRPCLHLCFKHLDHGGSIAQ